MSDDATPRLSLPYLAGGQAQKHLTVNEALARLDGLVQAAVESRSVTAQPTAPADGAAWILPAGRTGAEWALHPPGALLRFEAGDWSVLPTPPGATVYVRDEGRLLLREAAGWSDVGAAVKALQNLKRLGLGTTADAVNPLAAKLNKVLFTARGAGEGGDGDLRYTLNKETAADVLSLLLQTGFSGRAELGLVGDDDLRLKVSADGAAWREALRVEAATGQLWTGGLAAGRELAANLLPDSGRFIGAAANTTFSGAAFSAPAYLAPSGGSTFAAHHKFIHDNTDYGGSAGALHPDVKALVDQIRPAGARRFGPEWWVMKVVRGTGTVEPSLVGGDLFDLAFTNQMTALPRRLTAGYYVKLLSGKAAIYHNATQGGSIGDTAYGPQSPPTVLTPADGWKHVNLLTGANAYGYEYNLFALRATHGAELLLAMPRVAFGHMHLDPALGVLPNERVWG